MKSKAELLAHVKAYAPRGGMRVNILKESWPGAPQAIDELEREKEIIVLRGKDGQGMRTVFENNVKDAIEVQDGEGYMVTRRRLNILTQLNRV